ncbi:hypothetical protein KJ707_00990 [Patescibacteria group bacterium]|nr:hypothetical protein [Patescibacteria group bacterium]MBU2543129.1 hypothetical protein [Patescibacteria group bacterium]
MNIHTTIAGNLGTFKAPSSAFAPTTGADAATTFERILSIALGGFTIIAAVYFLLLLAVAAFTWIGAAGDTGKITKARDTMTNGLIGLVILVSVYAIAGVVGTILGIDLLNPGKMLLQLAPK